MEERKWEELSIDCLENVFGRLGIESLLLDIPFVCKSWYKASLSPLCWQRLVFPFDLFKSKLGGGRFNANGLIKFVVDRSQRSATSLVTIMQGCKELVHFDVRDCAIDYGETADYKFARDDERLKLASHISTFKYQISEYRWREAKYIVDDYENEYLRGCAYGDN